MRIREDLDLAMLEKYGFEKIDKEEVSEYDEWDCLKKYDYMYDIGYSRRCQSYYLLVRESGREVKIYASRPDGSGCEIGCTDVLIDLITDGIIVK